MIISTRRFFARPIDVTFEARGRVSANPLTSNRFSGSPEPDTS